MARITKSFLRDKFLSIDTRTLGLARIAIGLLLLFDLAKRANEMSIWFFETGLIPNAMLAAHPMRPYGMSFLSYVSSDTGVRLAFALIAVVYLCFLFGFLTRLFHVLSFVCLVSLQIRVDLVANGGDFVFCDLVLWTAFLPMGASFSIDSWRRSEGGKPPTRSPVVSWAVLVAILQLAVIYYFNAVHKSGETWINGTAVYWLAQQERIVTGPGFWMRENLPLWVFQFLTYFSLVVEYLLPWLILSPWGRPWTRRAAILGILALHLGIAAIANVGLFSFVMIAYSTLLISTEDWDWLRDKLSTRRGDRSRLVRALTLPPADAMPERPRSPLRWVTGPILAYLFIVATSQVLVENPGVPNVLKHEQPQWIQATVQTFRLNQGWKMFASNAPRDDMWIVVDAVTEDGRHIDPFNELGSRHSDPALRTIPPRLAQNYYFCDYTARIKGFRAYHRGLVDWIYRHHERTGNDDDRIVSFRVYHVAHIPPAPGEDEPHDVKARSFLQKQR